jgi:hypothetical protein
MRDYYEFTDLGIVLIQPRAPRSLASSSFPFPMRTAAAISWPPPLLPPPPPLILLPFLYATDDPNHLGAAAAVTLLPFHNAVMIHLQAAASSFPLS